MNLLRKTFALLALFALWAGSAWAGTTDIEYLPTTSAGHAFNHAPVGQTFVAKAAKVKAGLYIADQTSFTNWLATVYPGQIQPGSYPYAVAPRLVVNVKLMAGAGTGGAVLHSQDLVLNAPMMGFVDVDYAAAGVTLTVGGSYTLLVSDISGQAYPNGVVGWVVPSVTDLSTGAALPPGAYPAGQPILQGSLVTQDAGIGDNAFHVVDQNPGGTTTTACSGAYATITSVGGDFIVVNGGASVADRVWYAPTAGTTFVGGTTTFVAGELVSYAGALDPAAGCYASTMTVMPAPAPIVVAGTLPNGQVGAAYSALLTAAGGVAPYTWSATGVPPGLGFYDGTLSGTPSTAGNYAMTVSLIDARGTMVQASYDVAIARASTLSCTTTPSAQGKGKITAIGADYIVVGTKKITILPCTLQQYNNYSTSFKVGQSVEWKGYTLGKQLIATRVAGR